jgi:hypothetical protein
MIVLKEMCVPPTVIATLEAREKTNNHLPYQLATCILQPVIARQQPEPVTLGGRVSDSALDHSGNHSKRNVDASPPND